MDEWKSAACGAGKRSQRRNLQADGDSRNTARSASHCGVRMTIVSDMPILTTWRAQRNCDVSTTAEPSFADKRKLRAHTYRVAHPEHVAAKKRESAENNPDKMVAAVRRSQARHPDHVAARLLVKRAVKLGVVMQQSCWCGDPNRMPITTTVTLRSASRRGPVVSKASR